MLRIGSKTAGPISMKLSGNLRIDLASNPVKFGDDRSTPIFKLSNTAFIKNLMIRCRTRRVRERDNNKERAFFVPLLQTTTITKPPAQRGDDGHTLPLEEAFEPAVHDYSLLMAGAMKSTFLTRY
ncbi:jg19144 [Pararge aegeria aegeria]|uniref:Jg19144 protein n=1 Tax=Pararge aegeria aegeria TaxID=348720 RepID=A0A8S4RMK5_9NEOP|nr:jg19144 [Pararge aegeria aegeria]